MGMSIRHGIRRFAQTRRDSALGACAYVQALFMRLRADNSGAAAAEYGFLIAFISILAALGMVLLGDDIKIYFEDLAAGLDNASAPTPDPFAT